MAGKVRVAALYHHHMVRNPRRERLFIGSIAFLVSAVLTRALTLAIRFNLGPFHNVSVGGTHVHHLVWGILLLLVVGYLSLIELGTGDPARHLASRLTAAAFGIGAALTLDEFALWLNLKDVYWERQGKESVEAILIFGAVLSAGLWGAPLIRALVRGELAAVGELEHLEHRVTHHGQEPPGGDQPNPPGQTPV